MPTNPLPLTTRCGDDVPVSPTKKTYVLDACCSIENVPVGVVVPMPTLGSLDNTPPPVVVAYTVKAALPCTLPVYESAMPLVTAGISIHVTSPESGANCIIPASRLPIWVRSEPWLYVKASVPPDWFLITNPPTKVEVASVPLVLMERMGTAVVEVAMVQE